MRPLALAALFAALAVPAAALSPEADAFVRTIQPPISPQDLALAESHGEIETLFQDERVRYSVESLAREKKKNMLVRFVATRVFAANLSKFNGRGFPEFYERLYLTEAERAEVVRKVKEALLRG
jgi:hypothetical protein